METRVNIGRTFDPQRTYLVKVIAVKMRVDTEQPSCDGLDGFFECTGKRYAYNAALINFRRLERPYQSCLGTWSRRPRWLGSSS